MAKSDLCPTTLLCPMRTIEADSEDAWPEAMLRALADRADDIAAYHMERARVDRAAEDDVALRTNRPLNPYQPAWDAALEAAEKAVAGLHIAGFHASRLTERECAEITSNGLRVLSPELLERRLKNLPRRLPGHVISSLGARNHVREVNRSGR